MSTRATLHLKDGPDGFHLYEEVFQDLVEVEFSPGSVNFNIEAVPRVLADVTVHVPWLTVELPAVLMDKIAELHAAKKLPHQHR